MASIKTSKKRYVDCSKNDDDSAVFMVIDSATEDKFMAAIEPFGGDVMKTSLSFEDEEGLKKLLSEA